MFFRVCFPCRKFNAGRAAIKTNSGGKGVQVIIRGKNINKGDPATPRDPCDCHPVASPRHITDCGSLFAFDFAQPKTHLEWTHRCLCRRQQAEGSAKAVDRQAADQDCHRCVACCVLRAACCVNFAACYPTFSPRTFIASRHSHAGILATAADKPSTLLLASLLGSDSHPGRAVAH